FPQAQRLELGWIEQPVGIEVHDGNCWCFIHFDQGVGGASNRGCDTTGTQEAAGQSCLPRAEITGQMNSGQSVDRRPCGGKARSERLGIFSRPCKPTQVRSTRVSTIVHLFTQI